MQEGINAKKQPEEKAENSKFKDCKLRGYFERHSGNLVNFLGVSEFLIQSGSKYADTVRGTCNSTSISLCNKD